METWRLGDLETWRHRDMDTETSNGQQKMEAQANFLHPFTVCSSCIQKFSVYPFDNKGTNKSYTFANKLKITCPGIFDGGTQHIRK